MVHTTMLVQQAGAGGCIPLYGSHEITYTVCPDIQWQYEGLGSNACGTVMLAQRAGAGGCRLLAAWVSRLQARQASNQLLNMACRSSSCLCVHITLRQIWCMRAPIIDVLQQSSLSYVHLHVYLVRAVRLAGYGAARIQVTNCCGCRRS